MKVTNKDIGYSFASSIETNPKTSALETEESSATTHSSNATQKKNPTNSTEPNDSNPNYYNDEVSAFYQTQQPSFTITFIPNINGAIAELKKQNKYTVSQFLNTKRNDVIAQTLQLQPTYFDSAVSQIVDLHT